MSDTRSHSPLPDDELTRALSGLRGDAEHLPLAGADRVRRRGQARRRNQALAGSLAALAVLGVGGGVLTQTLGQDRGSGATVATAPPSASASPSASSSSNGAAVDLESALLLPAEMPYSDSGWKIAQTLDGDGTTYFSCQTDTLVRGSQADRVRTFSSSAGFTSAQEIAAFTSPEAAAAAVRDAVPTAQQCQSEGATTDLADYTVKDVSDLVPGATRALRISSSSNGGQWTYVVGFSAGDIAEVVTFNHGGQDSNYPTPPTALLLERAKSKLTEAPGSSSTGSTSSTDGTGGTGSTDGPIATSQPSVATGAAAAAALVPASAGLMPSPTLSSDLWPCQYDTDGLVGKAFAESNSNGNQSAFQRVTQWPLTSTAKEVASTAIATLDACKPELLPVAGSQLTYQELDPTPYMGGALPETAKAWLLKIDLPAGSYADGSSGTRWVQAIVMQQGSLVSEVAVHTGSDSQPPAEMFTKAAAAAAEQLVAAGR
ncbi:MAG: hypothetical protein ACTHK1_12615 [Actinomycetales bacterium]